MAITHASATTREALAQVVLDAIDGDAAAGTLELQTSGDSEVATLTLSYPCGTLGGTSNATLTFSSVSDDTNATGGTVAKFVIKDNSGDAILTGSVTVTGGGGDIELSSVAIGAGDTVSVSSLAYTSAT